MIVFIKNHLGDSIGRTVIPAWVVLVIEPKSNNRPGPNVRATPLKTAALEPHSDFEVLMPHPSVSANSFSCFVRASVRLALQPLTSIGAIEPPRA